VGDEAIWDRVSRTLTCTGCDLADVPVVEGQAGASALREYERRRLGREQHARERLGGVGLLLAKMIDEPLSTKIWRQGGRGEVRTGARLAKHLDGHGVFARRPGPLDAGAIERIWIHLGRSFPPA
jgi:hypothetical protein